MCCCTFVKKLGGLHVVEVGVYCVSLLDYSYNPFLAGEHMKGASFVHMPFTEHQCSMGIKKAGN